MKFYKYILIIFLALSASIVCFSQQIEFKTNVFIENFLTVSKSDVSLTSANWGINSGNVRLNRWLSLDGKSEFSVLPTNDNKSVNLKISSFDGNLGAVWVSKDSSKIYFSKWNGFNWSKADGNSGYDVLSENLSFVSAPFFEFDRFGRPNVVWTDSSGLYFSRWNGSVWSGLGNSSKFENISSVAESPALPILKIDSGSNPNILYQDVDGGKLYFIKWNGFEWSRADGITGGYDIVADDIQWVIVSKKFEIHNNSLQIAFSRISLDNFETKFVKWNGQFWSGVGGQTEGMETAIENTASFDFLVDSAGNPVFAWLDHSDKNIYFKRWILNNWTEPSQISFNGNASLPLMKLALDGTIGISWKNEANNDIYFSQLKGGKWVDTALAVGSDRVTKVGVSDFEYFFDKNSNPVFSYAKYFGSVNSDYILFFTRWNGKKWSGADLLFSGSDKVGVCLSGSPRLFYTISADAIFIFCSNNKSERFYKHSSFYASLQEAVSSRIFTAPAGFGIYSAKLSAKDEAPAKTNIEYFISANDGADWFLVEKDKVLNFSEPGIDLRWKANLVSSDLLKTPSVFEVKIEYTVSTGTLSKTEEIKPEKEIEAVIRPESEFKEEPIIEAEKEITVEIKESVVEQPVIATAPKAVLSTIESIIPEIHTEPENQTTVERAIDVSSGVVTAASVTTAVAVSTGVTAIGTARAAVSLMDFPFFLARFFSGFFVFFSARKKLKKPWGVVYDSQTKQPLDPVHVSLLNEKGEEVTSAITDLDGRFGFFPEPGRYKLKPSKTNYRFPSAKLFGKAKDEIYDNLYFGETVEVLEKGAPVNINIPMDSEKFDWNEFAKKELGYIKINPKKEKFKNAVSGIIFYSGMVSAPVFYLFNPSKLNLLFIVFYLFIIAIRIFRRKRRSFGLVYDLATNFPLSYAIIKVYYSDLDYMVKSTVCDKLGRYHLIVPKGKYYLKVEKKEADGSYKLISTTSNFTVKKGYINLKLKI